MTIQDKSSVGSHATDPLPPRSVEERARDPHKYFRLRRLESAIEWNTNVDGTHSAVIVNGAEVWNALHSDAYTARGGVSHGRTRDVIPTQVDPPEHTRYRAYLDPLMRGKQMAGLESVIAAHAVKLLERIAPVGHCDFRDVYATPLPAVTFLSLMGMPQVDLPFLLEFKDAVLKPPGETVAEQRASQTLWASRGDAYLAERVNYARRHSADNLMRRLCVAEVDGIRLTDTELIDISFQLVLGGLDTVTAAMTLFWQHLANNRDHRTRLTRSGGPTQTEIEEMLRWTTPVWAIKRRTVNDVKVRGCPLHAGQSVLLSLASANSDPEIIDRPDVVDLDRKANKHLTFGSGIHRCLGSHLARLQLGIALREWHRVIPEYTVVEPELLSFSDAGGIRTLDKLPLKWVVA